MVTRGEVATGDAAVEAATGRRWRSWFAILDRWGARRRSHREIAHHLRTTHRLPPWWSQTVAVRYEQVRGMREVGQRSDGRFALDLQRTVRATPAGAWAALTRAAMWNRWFTRGARLQARPGGRYSTRDRDRGTFLVVDAPRRLVFTWDNPDHCPGTRVEIRLAPRPPGRVTLRLSHLSLASRGQLEEMRAGWSGALDNLKRLLESW